MRWQIKAAGVLLLLVCSNAHALDHGFNKNDALVKWFEGLHRARDNFPCCGLSDAYQAEIIRMPTDAEDGIAEITDGSARVFPNGDVRKSVPNGTIIPFSRDVLTREGDGNPTGTDFVFMAVPEGSPFVVYCVVPKLPSS